MKIAKHKNNLRVVVQALNTRIDLVVVALVQPDQCAALLQRIIMATPLFLFSASRACARVPSRRIESSTARANRRVHRLVAMRQATPSFYMQNTPVYKSPSRRRHQSLQQRRPGGIPERKEDALVFAQLLNFVDIEIVVVSKLSH
eukprot:IDg16207t1